MPAASARILYYAFGGGLGHATRILALMRHLARRRPGEHRLLLNTPFAGAVVQEVAGIPGARLQTLAPSATPDVAREFLKRQQTKFRPDCLIVDTFPRGLGGELADLLSGDRKYVRVLISRGLPRAYVDEFRLVDFVDDHFDLVIAPGETSPFAATRTTFQMTSPFLIRDLSDLSPPVGQKPRVLIVASGTHAECRDLVHLARQVQVIDTDCPIVLALPPGVDDMTISGLETVRCFPVMEVLPGICGVAGAAGYNLAHEVAALNIPALLFPRHRLYDDQRPRATASVPSAADIVEFVADVTAKDQPNAPAEFFNGAAAAADRIAALPRSQSGDRHL